MTIPGSLRGLLLIVTLMSATIVRGAEPSFPGSPTGSGTAVTPGAPDGSDGLPRIPFEKFVLPNGAQVILHVDRKLPLVHVNQWFHVGSADERPGRTGFAHLFEHLMFQGSQNASGEYFTWVERAGANLREGGVNGTTSPDRTNYFATVPSGNLEYLLWLESDRLATLLDALTQENLDNQRAVVRNERRQWLENTPYGRIGELLPRHLFPEGHPYSWPVIGSHHDLEAATLEDVREFFRTHYSPSNLSLAIVGDFDPATARALVRKYYGPIPAGPARAKVKRLVPELRGETVVEAIDRVPQARLYLAWPVPPLTDPDEAPLEVTARLLTDGLQARLPRLLVFGRGQCSAIWAALQSGEMAGMFVITAILRPGATFEEVEGTIGQELARLAAAGPTGREVARVQVTWETAFISGLERIGGFGGKADLLNQSNVFWGDPGAWRDEVRRLRAVTPADVQRVTARWLDRPDRLRIRFRPLDLPAADPDSETTAALPPLDRANPPALGGDLPFTLPTVTTATLSNGLTVQVLPRPELPRATVTLVVKGGSSADPPGQAGAASLLLAAIGRGTASRSALEIEEDLRDLGTGLGGGGDTDSWSIGVGVLKPGLASATRLLAEVARWPAFPTEEVAKERGKALDGLAQAANDPTSLALRLAARLLWGPSHPYGHAFAGVASEVAALTRDDLVRMHETWWTPDRAALIVAGDITTDEAMGLASDAFGDWARVTAADPRAVTDPGATTEPGAADDRGAVTEPNPAPFGHLYLCDRPGAVQTVIAQVLPGAPRGDPDLPAWRLADTVWGGGGFGTRLMLNLREEKGYTYGVRSYLTPARLGGSWMAVTSVQADKTGESVREMLRELDDLGKGRPIGEAEFAAARTRWDRGMAQGYESLGAVTAKVAAVWAAGLPPTTLQEEYDQGRAVTLDRLREVAAVRARGDRAFLVLVGDRATVTRELGESGLPTPVQISPEGFLVPHR
ncbi:MAG: insulinase family protein [Candidatus Riflebacteria bacterium]|nr:insulinase family protein [Candidatus Riflebacteria bacterium]